MATLDLSHLDYTGRELFYWQGYYGQGVKVAVIDTGIEPNHPEFVGKNIEKKNYLFYGDGTEDNFHGTFCSALIAGKNVGVAPKADIVSYKCLDNFGSGSITDVILALNDISNRTDIDIISMSIAFSQSELVRVGKLAEFEQSIQNCIDKNIAVIVACGNTGDNTMPLYPASFKQPITVGALDKNLTAAYFSTVSNEVDLSQIGVDVCSANFEGGYMISSGTSFSTPITVGIACLIASKYKILFGKRIPEPVLYEMLKMNTIDIGAQGFDNKTGVGLCTLKQAMRKLELTVDTKNVVLTPINSGSILVDGVSSTTMVAPFMIKDTVKNLTKTVSATRETHEKFGHKVTYVNGKITVQE